MGMNQAINEYQTSPLDNVSSPDSLNQPISSGDYQNAQDKIKKLQDQIAYAKAINFSSSQKINLERKKALKGVFDKMASVGVNLNDRNSVASFISRLKQVSPETADSFEKNIDSLMKPVGL